MVNQADIIGIPVVIVSEGACIGFVAHIAVTSQGNAILGLAIYEKGGNKENPSLFVESDNINAIGSAAVTVQTRTQVRPIQEEDMKVLGSGASAAKAITTMGEPAGEVVDFKIDLEHLSFGSILLKQTDPETGSVSYYEANADAVVTYGSDFTIVKADLLIPVNLDGDQVAGAQGGSDSGSSSVPATSETPAEPVDSRREEIVKQYSDLLVGKTLAKEVTRPDGGIVALKGTVINEELIQTVYNISPNMLEILALFAK